ncbi:MAG: HAMP domain-containing sensor histidine kinase [Bacteroidota bacterium]
MLTKSNITTSFKEVSSTAVLMSLSPDGYILSCSTNIESIYNVNRLHFTDYNFFDLINEADIAKCEDIIDNLTQGLTLEIDFRIKAADDLLKRSRGVIFQMPHEYSKVKNEIIWVTIPQLLDEQGETELKTSKKYNFIIAENSNNIFLNNELIQLFGIDDDDDISELIFDSNRRKFEFENFIRKLEEGELVSEDIYIKNKENKYLQFTANIIKYSSENKDVLIIILSEKQVNSKQILEFDNADITELQQKINERDKFFSVIAHDLRSPFTAILGYSEYMASYYENLTREEIHDFSNNMYKASKSVFKLLEDLLKWTRIQSGRISLEKEIFSIVPLLNRAVEMFRSTAEKKDIRLIYNPPDFEIFVNADEEMISSVIRNLLSNAVKFTEKNGFVKVSINLNNGFVSISVIDNGIGIDKATLSKLFKVGERVTRYGTNDEEGSGLGLILSKEFIQKNGGDIFVDSKVGEGSSFTVKLPIAAA